MDSRAQLKALVASENGLDPLTDRHIGELMGMSGSAVYQLRHRMRIKNEKLRRAGFERDTLYPLIRDIIFSEPDLEPISDETLRDRLAEMGYPMLLRRVSLLRDRAGFCCPRERLEKRVKHGHQAT